MKKITSILALFVATACATPSRAPSSTEAVNGIDAEAEAASIENARCAGINPLYAGMLDPQFKKLQNNPDIETLITIDPDNQSLIVYERTASGWKWTKGSQLDPGMRVIPKKGAPSQRTSKVPQGIFPKEGTKLEFFPKLKLANPPGTEIDHYVRFNRLFGMGDFPEKPLDDRIRSGGLVFMTDGDGDQSMAKTIFDLVKSKPDKTKIVIADKLHAGLRGCPL